jgi:hypothetical protein
VTASKTRLRGASKTRVRTISRSDGIVNVSSTRSKTLVPEAAIALDSPGDVLERARLEPAGPALRLTPAHYQAGALHHVLNLAVM